MNRVYTKYLQQAIDSKSADQAYLELKDRIPWENGIIAKSGFTRKGYQYENFEEDPLIMTLLRDAISALWPEKKYVDVYGVYLNYYANGDMWTPNHSHKGTAQVVISLGATRTLKVSGKDYSMSSGSAIVFGSAVHGVPKESQKEGRISIAAFLSKT